MEIVTKVEPYWPLDNYPVEYKRVVRTREDLENIPLEPSKRIIRLYDDTPYSNDVDWDGKLANGFKRYCQLWKDASAKHVDLNINENGYRLRFCGADNLDVSNAVATLVKHKRQLNGYIEVFIPYRTQPKPLPWYRTWPGVWNQIRTIARRYV